MKRVILAGTTALALAIAPSLVSAQDGMMNKDGMKMDHHTMKTPEQMTMYDGWTAEQRASFDAMPSQQQGYFWTLDENQRRGWDALNEEQRTRIYAMAPQQRTAAWNSVMAQISGEPMAESMPRSSATPSTGAMGSMSTNTADMARTSTAMPAQTMPMNNAPRSMPMATSSGSMNSNMQFVSQPMIQRAPAPLVGEYPLCNNGRTDNCMNPWEAGKRGPGVTKPLGY